MNNTSKVKQKEYLGYFGYGFGQCISFGIVGSFSLYFFTDIVGLTAIMASTIFLISRVWDAVNDPMLASIIDKSHKKGKEKFIPFLKLMPIFMAIVTILLFTNLGNMSYAFRAAYCFVFYMLWGMIYTVSDVSFWSVSTVISDDSQERTKLITAANIGVFAGIGFAGALVPKVTTYLGGLNSSRNIFITVSLAMIFLLIPFTMLGTRQLIERVQAEKTEKITFKKIFENIKVNKPLRFILLMYFLNIGMNVVQTLGIYFFTSNLNNADLFSTYSIMTTFAALGFFILPSLTKRFKKRNILFVLLTVDTILRLGFFMLGYENAFLTTVILGLLFAIYAITAPILSVMIAETIEYTEYKTGIRAEAVTFSGQTFSGKLSVALAGTFAGFLLSIIQYDSELKVQSDFTLQGLFIVMSLLPAIFSILRMIVLKFLKYDEDAHAEIVAKLKERANTETI